MLGITSDPYMILLYGVPCCLGTAQLAGRVFAFRWIGDGPCPPGAPLHPVPVRQLQGQGGPPLIEIPLRRKP